MAAAAEGFRFNAKKAFVTYSQSGSLTKEAIRSFFEEKYDLKKYLIVTEDHKDGNPHIHCGLEFSKKLDIKNAQEKWIIDGHKPNISTRKDRKDFSWNSVERYCTKSSEDYITNYYKPKENPFSAIYDDNFTASETLAQLRSKRPRDMAIHGEAIERAVKRQKAKPFQSPYNIDQFNIPPIPFPERSDNILLWGTTNTGKTHYALAHFKRPFLVKHVDMLKNYDEYKYDGIVYDDMNFAHWPPGAVISLLDTKLPHQQNVKHGIALLPPGRKQIFTYNNDNPFYATVPNDPQAVAIDSRVKKVEITDPLFNKA